MHYVDRGPNGRLVVGFLMSCCVIFTRSRRGLKNYGVECARNNEHSIYNKYDSYNKKNAMHINMQLITGWHFI